MKKKSIIALTAGLVAAASINVTQAASVFWTDWTNAEPSTVSGSLDVNGSSVGVTFSGEYSAAQTSGGTNFWSPSAPYISPDVGNAPPASDIIELGYGGTKTITFSETIEDPLLALVSWNANIVDFGTPIQILSSGLGYWGIGTPILNSTGTGFTGTGEVHAVIRLPGAFNSITFTDTTEFWHGLTVGVTGLNNPNPSVPEPGIMLLIGAGITGWAASRARRKIQ